MIRLCLAPRLCTKIFTCLAEWNLGYMEFIKERMLRVLHELKTRVFYG